MWNKFNLRMKITILTALVLSLVTGGITALSIYNAGQIFVTPIQTGQLEGPIEVFLLPDDARANALTELQGLVSQQQVFFSRHSTIIAIIFVMLGTLTAYVIAGQVLKPIKSLAEKMEEIDVSNLSQPIKLPKAKDEVSRLTQSFNNMLGKLNRSFETQKLFAQNAAHELKTPLASMRANIEVLQLEHTPSVDEYEEVIGTVKDGTERLIGLVEGLLSIHNQIDEIRWQSFGAKAVFAQIMADLQAEIAERNLTVSISGDCTLKGDKALLERAFSNLVHNAVRYNVDGGTIAITLADNDITIQDSGVGISSEHLARIFEPFYCVDQSRSKKLGGHGLGLSIAKNIFDKHGMEITVSSEIGQGTKILVKQ